MGQEAHPIKALSPEEVDGLLDGKGLGFAKAAELNGYPDPAHVPEPASLLHLTDAQRDATRALQAQMHAQAAAMGSQLVALESDLDRQFADRTITSETLASRRRPDWHRAMHIVPASRYGRTGPTERHAQTEAL
jgi:hypothetical protein